MLHSYEDTRCSVFEAELTGRIETLERHLLPYMSQVKNAKSRRDLNSVFYISKGFLSVYRKSEDILLGHLHAPTFFGINCLYHAFFPIYFIGGNGTVLYSGDNDTLLNVIKKNALEENVLFSMISIVNELYRHDLITGKSDSYQAIKSILLHYSSKPYEFRMQFGIASIIIKLTGLSRSHVMRILSELKKGGYIETLDGKLISVGELPDKF